VSAHVCANGRGKDVPVHASEAWSAANCALSCCAACPFASWKDAADDDAAPGADVAMDGIALPAPRAVETTGAAGSVVGIPAADKTAEGTAAPMEEAVDAANTAPEAEAGTAALETLPFGSVTSVLSCAPSGTGLFNAGHEPGGLTASTPSGRFPLWSPENFAWSAPANWQWYRPASSALRGARWQ
jgi:hypothetical protein